MIHSKLDVYVLCNLSGELNPLIIYHNKVLVNIRSTDNLSKIL